MSKEQKKKPASISVSIGRAIRYQRVHVLRLRREDIATKALISPNTLQRIECGADSTVRVVENIARSMELTFYELMVLARNRGNDERIDAMRLFP